MINRSVILFIMISMLLNCSSQQQAKEVPIMRDFDKLWDFNDPTATEQKFHELLNQANQDEAPDYYLELKTQLARTLGLQQKFDDASALLDQVESELRSDYPMVTIRYKLERGRVFNSSGNKEKSKSLFLEAWELGQKVGADFFAVDAAHMLGIVEEPAQQLVWNEKAMALAEQSQDERAQGWLGSLYNNIGWTYHDMQNYDKALEIFLKALEWRESHQQVRETQIAKWCVARTYRSLGDIEKSIEIQLALEKEIQAAGQPEDGYVFEEIGECFLIQGKAKDAVPYFKKAYDLLVQDIWLKQNESARLERLKQLGS